MGDQLLIDAGNQVHNQLLIDNVKKVTLEEKPTIDHPWKIRQKKIKKGSCDRRSKRF